MLAPQALSDIGFDDLTRELAARARTPMGRSRCLSLPQLHDRAEVELHLSQVEEARARLRSADSPPLGDFGDVGTQLQRAEKQGLLDGPALLEIATYTRACSRLRGWLEDRAPQAPLLAAMADELADLPSITSRIEGALEPSGRVADRASPALGQLRDRLRQLHTQLRTKLEELLADERFQRNLRESYLTVRNDRYCVPVNAQFRAEVPGIVHNASQSGQTLFVEPQPLIGLGNELAIAQSMVLEEEQRLLLELTAEVGRAARDLRLSMGIVAAIDERFGGAALAEELGAHRPELLEASQPFAFEALRHPLLVLQARAERAAGRTPREIVPSDVLLSGKARALVISGPNAGGKTVTLTAVGLSVALVRCGLPIPAGPLSRVPLVSRLFTAIGDAQDIANGLSTFTAHLHALRRILDGALPGALALVDELAADTDPREGGALAVAVLEALLDKGALVVATTHLEPLKALALGDPRFSNAAVGFDPLALAPTYHVTLGSAGQSSALEVARRSGLPEPLLERAREHLSAGAGPLGAALEALEAERSRLARARDELERERAALAHQREEVDAREAAQTEREAALQAEGRRRLLVDVERAQGEVRAIVSQLQRAPELAQATLAQRRLQEIGAAEERALTRAPAPKTQGPALLVGQRVRSRTLGKDGELVAIEGDQGIVAIGAMKVRQPLAELERAQGKAPKARPPGKQDVEGRARDA
ncbi:MAG: endonuclease MutS2, partial [Deltaproteobacteria bacterium]